MKTGKVGVSHSLGPTDPEGILMPFSQSSSTKEGELPPDFQESYKEANIGKMMI